MRRALAAVSLAAALGHPGSASALPPGEGQEVDLVEQGRRVGEGFCLSCHVLDGPMSANPLRPRVRGWTREEAYDRVARLSGINPGMIDFEGTDLERRALAAWVAALGAEARPWRWGADATFLAALAAAAAAFAIRALRRGAGDRPGT